MTTAYDDENLGYAHGLAALQFFAVSGPEQVASWHKVSTQQLPWFFHEHELGDRSSHYFFGIGCIWTTYKTYLYERYEARFGSNAVDFGALTDFNHFESVHACTDDAAKWSETAVLEDGNDMWDGLRRYARRALSELGEAVPAEPPTFIIADLIAPDEFRTSDTVRKLLE